MTSGNLISFIIYEFVLGDCMEVRGWLGETGGGGRGAGEREGCVGKRDLNRVLQGPRDVGLRSKVGRAENSVIPITIIKLTSDSNKDYFRKCSQDGEHTIQCTIIELYT